VYGIRMTGYQVKNIKRESEEEKEEREKES
jgi:hypothetical protein